MFWELWHGNSWRGNWQGEFLKGRVQFLFGDVLSHYFLKNMQCFCCNYFVCFLVKACLFLFFHKCCAVPTIIKETGSGC